MGTIKRTLGIALLVAGAGVAAYHLLLTDEARNSLKNSYSSVKSAYSRISEVVSDAQGIVVGEAELPNQEATRLQWEALGF